jgi:rfaE bifunctional protein nucleotidyltransferase chain/domain
MVPYTRKPNTSEVLRAKILSAESLQKSLAVARFLGKKIVFTNGCFDILHLGHIDYLAKASDLGDELYIGLNSDESVRRQGKSASRPLQDEQSRAMILASLHFVSGVILFNEDTPEGLIRLVNPDVLVKGADYDATVTDRSDKRFIVGSDIVKKAGGMVTTIELLPGYSTTSIEQKIKSS